ncbi:MAG: hypothetical protein E7535_11230 [Ruminococcaceae bacterium]|nr:hypothetical protein [Oscillospiraceae bacterium]
MKKLISVFLVLNILLCAFSACSSVKGEQYPITVNGTPVDGEIFRYYLDDVWDSEEALGSRDGRITEATYKCIRYVAVNSTFSAYSLSLSDAEKVELSEKANVLWNMFGAYYEKIGVSKETYIKIKTSDAFVEKLRLAFFDKGGTDEISDALLRGVLQENFTAFRYVRTPLKTTDVYGNEIPLTDKEMNRLVALYNSNLNTVAASYTVEKAYTEIAEEFPLTEQSYENVVIDSSDHEFTTAFYNTVREMGNNTAKAFQFGEFVYLVYKTDIVNDGLIFSELRDECLKIISEEPLQSKINVMCNAYQSVRDTSLVREYYDEVAQNR